MTAAGRLGVGIIGAGRVGPVLGAGLAAAGHAITGISTVSDAGRDRAQALLPDAPILEIPQLVERSELVLLAIPEGELEALVSGLAATETWMPGQLVMHTAPGFGYGVLGPALSRGAIPLAVHPAMSFTGTSMDLVRLRESFCAVTAPTPVLPIAQALVVELGAEPVIVAEADRPAYAEAITTATSFSSEIVRQSIELLGGIGLEHPGAVIAPLVRSAVENALQSPPPAAFPE
ncbi:putative short-subunit dehydrogenase-like oxidoreductase (DUF2520 family) [Microbacteriaceae bacterium SG_E_30_P1]|uniref:Short-subunit dehydrogenase-like oxidoreductase (DUF2520 family) n=1 Tax=Antiquaquibacter oligotrophicus TaxID=2880260 RepID=A0ABT6KL46_9MICO|nr:Rossmann-like and DUF2520 domain-containing protein [Antiquaquibacter oligotrophicus]MDH6179832.1 putative short-subunit dehydrogenase-like oxidoreductase (DUF2520 family) [Antiquaquibacter oligotrophicus]UDF14406.1 DUF2520 domain-containing protein [Antiquaquibacter oligotrophicus]